MNQREVKHERDIERQTGAEGKNRAGRKDEEGLGREEAKDGRGARSDSFSPYVGRSGTQLLSILDFAGRDDLLTEAIVRKALRDCYDPEVPCNIVDLGLVYRVAVEVDTEAPGAGVPGVPVRHKVAIALTLTSKGCPAHTQIVAQIEGRLSAFPEISRTEVELVWEPAWTPERISAEGRKLLGID